MKITDAEFLRFVALRPATSSWYQECGRLRDIATDIERHDEEERHLLDRAKLAEDRLAIVEQQHDAAWKQLLELGIERNEHLARDYAAKANPAEGRS